MFNLATAVRNAMCNAAVDLLDSGVSDPVLVITEADDDVLLTITLNATAAFGDAAAGVATANDPQTGGGDWDTFSQNPSASGTAAKAKWQDGDGTTLFESTVSTIAVGTGEVQFTDLTFSTGTPVETTVAPTITMPAS